MTTPAKLFGRDISSYDEVDMDELLSKLTTEELNMLAKEVDPDVSTSLFRTFHRINVSKMSLIWATWKKFIALRLIILATGL